MSGNLTLFNYKPIFSTDFDWVISCFWEQFSCKFYNFCGPLKEFDFWDSICHCSKEIYITPILTVWVRYKRVYTENWICRCDIIQRETAFFQWIYFRKKRGLPHYVNTSQYESLSSSYTACNDYVINLQIMGLKLRPCECRIWSMQNDD